MQKLIELLNEFRPAISCANFKEHYEFIDDDIYLIREGIDGEEEHFPMYVCYKKGDFVKWLEDNDKIKDYYEGNEDIDYVREKYGFYEALLMLLSIQDEPIQFLIEILR